MTEPQNVNVAPKRRGVFLLVLVVFMVAALGFGGYFGHNFILDKISASEGKTGEFTAELKQLQAKYTEQQTVLQGLQNEIQKSNAAKTRNWQPIIIEHLIRMANLTLNTTGDVKLAISYLETAKQYANTQELSAINHALNKDIASLQVVPVVDATDLILKIESLNQKISSLPLVIQQFNGTQKQAEEEDSSSPVTKTTTLWQRLFASTTKALKDIVVIRRQVVEPLLSPEQETILRLNVQTKLLQAELAVMHRQNKLYQSCLEETTKLISKYFVTSNIVNSGVLENLKELQGVDLQPKLPLLSESIAATQNFMSANKSQGDLPL